MAIAIQDEFPGRDLTDRDQFNEAWHDYFMINNEAFSVSIAIRDEVYNRHIFKKAGGKNYEQDRRRTHKRVQRDPKEYIRIGAQRTDLPGVDTKVRVSRRGSNDKSKVHRISSRRNVS